METLKGWQEQLMFSFYKKESAYDSGVTMDNTAACQMSAFELETTWPDKIENDKGELTGLEQGYTQEILQQSLQLTYKQAKTNPNTLIGLASLVLGNSIPTKDGAVDAWKHHIIPVAVGVALPSMQATHLKGGLKYKYTGIKGNTLKISGEEGGFVSVEAGLIGSGTRIVSTENFVDKVVESWMNLTNCKVWMESGDDILISTDLVQDAEDISSTTPANLYPKMKSFEWTWDNGLAGQYGFGSGGKVFQDADFGRRKSTLAFSMLFKDATELDHFLNQVPLAIEFDLKGALIAATGTMYYGFQLIIPRFMLKEPPLPKGGVDDILTVDFVCEVFTGLDASSDPLPEVIIEGYNAKAGYFVAP